MQGKLVHISKRKTEVMTLNVQDSAPVKVEDDPLPYTEQFTYLGSTVKQNGGAGSDISNRIGKARNACGNHNNTRPTQN